MIKRKVIPGILTFILLFIIGCGKTTESPERILLENEGALIDRAKKDFLFPNQNLSTSLLMIDEFENLKVIKGKIFDCFKSPEGEEYWAVELEFMSNDKEAKEEKHGIAILQYGSFTVNGIKKEGMLMTVDAGTSAQEIKIIRANFKAVFDAMRKAKKIFY